MTKKEKTRDQLLLENHDLKRVIRRLAKEQCVLGGVGYNVPITFDNNIMFNSAKYSDIITCPLDDNFVVHERQILAGNSIETLEAAHERQGEVE